LGDPLNAIKIFNEKRVDELVIIDIDSSKNRTLIDFEYIESLCSECFMPVAYGGGIRSMNDIKKMFSLGIEKVIINSLLVENPIIIEEAIKTFGAQSIVASIDYKKHWLTKKTHPYIHSGTKKIKKEVYQFIEDCISLGVGEILLTNIDHEGTFKGYDFEIIKDLTLKIPIILHGGASSVENLIKGKKMGADALAAASLFCLQKPHLAVLITYLNENEITVLNELP
jgi:cyclase